MYLLHIIVTRRRSPGERKRAREAAQGLADERPREVGSLPAGAPEHTNDREESPGGEKRDLTIACFTEGMEKGFLTCITLRWSHKERMRLPLCFRDSGRGGYRHARLHPGRPRQ